MKRWIWVVFGLGALVVAASYLNRPVVPVSAPAGPVAESSSDRASEAPRPVRSFARSVTAPRQPTEGAGVAAPAPAGSTGSGPADLDATILGQTVDVLVSRQATYAQKQSAWKQLREAGKLDLAIRDLERRVADDPNTPEYAAVLGQAYLQKCGTIQDVREQGILAMQADKVFDTALNLDPFNWEARFTKAMALSYWPANLNKGEEVIQHFQTLIQQQEAQASQPQFAETYSWLGDQYQKAGRTDEARATWQRGAALFPAHEGLRTKLAAAP